MASFVSDASENKRKKDKLRKIEAENAEEQKSRPELQAGESNKSVLIVTKTDWKSNSPTMAMIVVTT